MLVNNIYSNDNLSFNARLKIKDIEGVLEKSDINYLRSKASKIGTKDDFIKVEFGIYEPATSSPWARRGLLGCFFDKETDMIDVSVTSVFNKKTKTDEFYCYGHNREDTSINLVFKLIKYCGNLADKLKK